MRRLLIALALLVSLVLVNSQGGDGRVRAQTGPQYIRWMTKAPMLVARLGGVAITGQDGRIYVFGGLDGNGVAASNYLTDAEVYTPSANSWTNITPLPVPDALMGGALGPGGKLYIFGGHSAGAPEAHNYVMAYDPASNTYQCSFAAPGCAASTLAPMPTSRYWLAVAASPAGLIFAIAGKTDHGSTAAIEAYDAVKNQWYEATPLPDAYYGVSAVTGPDGTIYVAGGVKDDFTTFLNTAYAFKAGSPPAARPSSGDRTSAVGHSRSGQLGPIPLNLTPICQPPPGSGMPPNQPDENQGVLAILISIYLGPDVALVYLGGANGSAPSDSAQECDLTTNKWMPPQPMWLPIGGPQGTWYMPGKLPFARANLMSATTPDGSLFVMGGGGGSLFGALSAVLALSPPSPPTPTPTSTAVATSTPTPTPTDTQVRLSVRATLAHTTVKAGSKQTITVYTLPRASISIAVAYPNGTKTRHSGTADGQGTASWTYKQPRGVTSGANRTARVTLVARLGTGPTVTAHKSYHIR